VSRILVADDNSNIQKMVALALKDEGIDVIAVGNGEAAMRRIPDLRPDLVLADVFMPVRNGYELCEFIKSDSRYMSTPVVLLVGAFDPLDEQETQRVRADGVLKKPFVPPDPLINMVKALLAKSNGQKSVPAAAPPAPPAAEQPQPHTTPAVTADTANASTVHVPAGPMQPQPTPAPKVKAPMQQGEANVVELDDSDQIVTATRDPKLGDPFWAAPAETEDKEAAEEISDDDPKDMVDMHSFGKEELPVEAERESVFRPDSPSLEALDSAGNLDETIVTHRQAGNSSESKASEIPAGGGDEISVTAQANEPSATQLAAPEATEAPAEIFKFDPTLTFASSDSSEAPAADKIETLSLPELTETKADLPSVTEASRSYDAEVPAEVALPSLPNRDAVISAATEAARLAFSEVSTLPGSGAHEIAGNRPAEPAHKETVSAYAPAAPVESSPTPEMIEAVVNRLIEQMQPQIMEVVNREVLRPAIEAIVRREMKKS